MRSNALVSRLSHVIQSGHHFRLKISLLIQPHQAAVFEVSPVDVTAVNNKCEHDLRDVFACLRRICFR